MALLYHPSAGEILVCTYPKDMKIPEMVKRRPVLVISNNLKGRAKLTTIVPLSTTTPKNLLPCHYKITFNHPLPEPWDAKECWAVCDHPMTVCFDRLDLIRLGKDSAGKRRYYQRRLDSSVLLEVRKAVGVAIGL